MPYNDSHDYDRASHAGSDSRDDKSGALFGGLFHVNPSSAPFIRLAINAVSPEITKWGEKAIHEGLPYGLTAMLGKPRAEQVSRIAAHTASLGFIFKDPALGFYQTTHNYASAMKALSASIAPVMEAGHHSKGILGLVSSDIRKNEVVQVAQAQIRHRWSTDSMQDISALATTLPQLAAKYYRYQVEAVRNHPGATQADIDRAIAQVANKEGMFDSLTRVSTAVPEGVNLILDNRQTKREDIALDLIRHLAKEVVEAPGADLIDAPYGMGQIKIKNFVKEILNCHQRNCKETELGPRVQESLGYATSRIAEEIAEGRVHPMALVRLVGEREIVKHGGKKIASHADIDKAIARHEKEMPAHTPVDVEAYMTDAALTVDDIKGLLHDLKGTERDYFVSLFPDEVMKKAGLSSEQIIQSHQHSAEHFLERSKEAINEITARDPETLKKSGLTDEDIDALEELKYRIKRQGSKAIKDAISRPGEYKGIETTIANDLSYWQGVVARQQSGAPAKAAPEAPRHRLELPPEREAASLANDDDLGASPLARISREHEYLGSQELLGRDR